MKIAIVGTVTSSLLDAINNITVQSSGQTVLAEVETVEPEKAFKLCASYDVVKSVDDEFKKANKWSKPQEKRHYKHKLKKNKRK